MEFKSQICTTKEQSKRLLDLGIKKETADMGLAGDIPIAIEDWKFQDTTLIDSPAWSLHRLIEIAEVSARISGVFGYGENNNIYDELIDTMQDFINNDVFNKDYLIKE